jgi:outer membrane lipoprotein carrier protein
LIHGTRDNLLHSSTRLGAITLIAFCMSVPAGAVQQATPMVDPGAWLQHYLEGFGSFQAEFRQLSSNSAGDRTTESAGTLYLQKPGRFRWDYRKPDEQLIVSDGAKVWLYDVQLEQVTVKTLDESLSTTPALLLAGRSTITNGFTVIGLGNRAGIDWLQLTPKRTDTDFVEFRLGFASGELKVMELKDKLQQSTRIEFSRIRRNPQLAAGLFTFVPPAGVDVIGAPRG